MVKEQLLLPESQTHLSGGGSVGSLLLGGGSGVGGHLGGGLSGLACVSKRREAMRLRLLQRGE